MNDDKLLKLINSDLSGCVLGVLILLQLGEDKLFDFIRRNGNPLPDSIISKDKFALRMYYDIPRRGASNFTWIRYLSPSSGDIHRIYCGANICIVNSLYGEIDENYISVDLTKS